MPDTGHPMTLEQAAENGRDNNLNLIRFVAAFAVLASHAWPIALGPAAVEPLRAFWGHSLGGIAVIVFFALSGFLITGSWARRPDAAEFTAARALRLLPGLAVVVTLTALLLGPAMTVLPLAEYLTDPATPAYVLRNLSLAFLQYPLPGVFEGNPYGPAVNGSLWTLFHEALCYALVLALGLAGGLATRRRATLALMVYAGLYILTALPDVAAGLSPRAEAFRALSLPFVLGVAGWVWRAAIPLRWDLAVGASALALVARGTPLATEALVLALSYGVAVLAWRPGGAIRGFNRLGDYSYGIYILAFPIQQTAVALLGPMTPALNIALAAPVTLVLAIASWHLVERPALARKTALAAALTAAAASLRPSERMRRFRSTPKKR